MSAKKKKAPNSQNQERNESPIPKFDLQLDKPPGEDSRNLISLKNELSSNIGSLSNIASNTFIRRNPKKAPKKPVTEDSLTDRQPTGINVRKSLSYQNIQDVSPKPIVPGSLLSKIGQTLPQTDRKTMPTQSYTWRDKHKFNLDLSGLPYQLQKPLVANRQRLQQSYKGLSKSRKLLSGS